MSGPLRFGGRPPLAGGRQQYAVRTTQCSFPAGANSPISLPVGVRVDPNCSPVSPDAALQRAPIPSRPRDHAAGRQVRRFIARRRRIERAGRASTGAVVERCRSKAAGPPTATVPNERLAESPTGRVGVFTVSIIHRRMWCGLSSVSGGWATHRWGVLPFLLLRMEGQAGIGRDRGRGRSEKPPPVAGCCLFIC